MRRFPLLAGLLAVVVPPFVSAQVHMCKSPDGRKVFSDLPCGPDSERIEVKPAAGGLAINPGASQRTEHYEIRGTTWPELREQIGAKGPEGFWGSAATGIGYELRARPSPQGCAVVPESVRASSEAVIRLPRWANRHEGPVSLQSYWDNVYRSLDLHERGHVRINFDGAKELERAIHALPPQASCEMVEPAAKRVADEVRARVARRQADYDLETNHGRRQWTPYNQGE